MFRKKGNEEKITNIYNEGRKIQNEKNIKNITKIIINVVKEM